MFSSKQPGWKMFVPTLNWHGPENQYHIWLVKILGGDFGTSVRDGKLVSIKIMEAIRWTLLINITALFLAFAISIPIGVAMAKWENTLFDKLSNGLLFMFFAIPSFWLATILVVFFTTSEYGAWTDIFPTAGLGNYESASNSWERFIIISSHLALPIFCLMIGSLAYLSRQMRQGILNEIKKDYILVARARGQSEKEIYWKHAFRNALFPIITIFAAAFPASISGSVIIEVIFNIPGMGRLLYDSILTKDWQVLMSLLLLAGLLTIIGYLVADILYNWFDPRVKFISGRRKGR
jgi:peptide/nickel transport system permease protein